MTETLPLADRFSFTRRPLPIPGDLRIAWRLALLLLILHAARGNKASLAKLHVLNDALRSEPARQRLAEIATGREQPSSWRVKVEPALSRAVDFVVGEHLAEWTAVSGRAALKLTPRGIKAAEAVSELKDALVEERKFLDDVATRVPETLVSSMVRARKEL